MAKVSEIVMNVNGKDYKYNINVGKSGIFTCKIDYHIAKEIGIESTLEFSTLKDLEKAVYPKYHEYLNAKVETTLWIGIVYKVNGFFTRDPETEDWFIGATDRRFYKNGTSWTGSEMEFAFMVYLREDASTGVRLFWKTRFVDGKFIKDGQAHGIPGIMLPYSDEAYKTLEAAKKGLQSISKKLHDVFSKDPKDMLEFLEQNKVLPEPRKEDSNV